MKAVRIKSEDLPSHLRGIEPSVKKAVVKQMWRAAEFGRTAVIQTARGLRQEPFAAGTYQSSWMTSKSPDGAEVGNTSQHAIYVEVGRNPGRAPPRDPLVAWARLKKKQGRLPPGLAKYEPEQIAFLVQRSIAKKGMKGRYVMKKTVPRIADYFERGVKRALDMMPRPEPK